MPREADVDVDPAQLVSGLIVISVFFALPFLLVGRNRARDAVGRGLQRVGTRALRRVQRPDPEADAEDPEFEAVQERARLLADLERLDQLVHTDAGKSATRQRANRMAYARLQAELAAAPPVRMPIPVAAGAAPVAASRRESLDVDWRR